MTKEEKKINDLTKELHSLLKKQQDIEDEWVKLFGTEEPDPEIFGDLDESHARADEILCEILILEGYQEIVDSFRKLRKWYS